MSKHLPAVSAVVMKRVPSLAILEVMNPLTPSAVNTSNNVRKNECEKSKSVLWRSVGGDAVVDQEEFRESRRLLASKNKQRMAAR